MIVRILLFSILNRCRGSHFYNLVNSTTLSRILSATLMAIVASFQTPSLIPLIACGLDLWMTPAWDKYWSAAIGNPTDLTAKAFAPVDWIMLRLWHWPVQGIQLRLWGTVAMGLRGGLPLYPLFAVLGFAGYPIAFVTGLATFFQGIPYLIGGIPCDKAYSVPFAEYVWGAVLGLLFATSLQ